MICEKVKLGKVAFGWVTSNVLVSDNYPTSLHLHLLCT